MHDPKERFSNRVDAYVAARPGYPVQVLTHLRDAIGLQPFWTIADIGCGTGISSRLFLENGNAVIGVEPNAPMRSAAEASLGAFANFKSINACAEATTLPGASVDLITAAQAFHWFDHEAAHREWQRILRPRGWALLLWNRRQLTGTPFLDAYEKLLITFGTDYLKIRHYNISDVEITRFLGSDKLQSACFPNHQHLDFEGLRARLLSSSYTPPPTDPRHPKMLKELEQIFSNHNHQGQVTIEYQTELFYGRLT